MRSSPTAASACRASPRCAATRTTASPTRCRPGIAFPLASTRCCARGSRRMTRLRGARRARGDARRAAARAHAGLGRARRERRAHARRAAGARAAVVARARRARAALGRSDARGGRDSALAAGAGANLGGGTHHAFPHAGRGFCLFNDVVAATRALRARGRLRRVLVVDLDVHQGDGTHAALAGDDEAFTFALNGMGNYPFPPRRRRPRARPARPARATTPTSTRSRRSCRRRSRERAPSSASTSRAPTRSRAIASAGWRSRTRAWRSATGSCARRCCAPASRSA